MKIFKFSPRQKAITASVILFALLSFFIAGGLDANYIIFKKNNPIAGIGELLNFAPIAPQASAYILLLFICLYLIVGAVSLFIVLNKIHEDGKTILSSGLLPYVILIGVVGFIVFVGLGMLFAIPEGAEGIKRNITFVGETLLISIVGFAAIYAVVLAIYLLIMALPFTARNAVSIGGEAKDGPEEEKISEADLSNSFDTEKKSGGSAGANAAAGAGVAIGTGAAGAPLDYDKNRIFPGLVAIDDRFLLGEQALPFLPNGLTLRRFVEDLQNYLATSCSLYYSLDDLAIFVSAILTTPLTILEGVSGTGKSSLPRYFAKFIGENAYFESVQMTYKDRDDILGYYNDFTGVYFETEFLKRLYEATYRLNHVNLMVLDEMNISRVEYYFADFLSVMEFPEDQRRIHVVNVGEDAPVHLSGGDLLITPNTRFVGTCNTDDSTFAITDKVIDRAIVLDFDEFHEPLSFSTKAKPLAVSNKDLVSLAEAARKDKKLAFDSNDQKKLVALLKEADDCLGIKTGNRFLNQASSLSPVYAAVTGSKEGAIDYLFAFKVLRKAKGRVDAGYRSGLRSMGDYLKKTYGDAFKKSLETISREIRRLG